MRAVRYHGPGEPLRLEDVPTPEPAPGEVLLRVEAAGVCGTELHFLSGLLDLGVRPLTLGHEVAGTVEAVGPGVDDRRPGDRAVLYYYVGCGRCPACRRGDENLCPALRAEHGFLTDGGFAEYVTAPARNVVPLPEGLESAAAAPIGCSVTTAVHACGLAGVGLGDVVVVYGIGAVGFGLVQVARLRGAEVVAVGRTTAKLARASELGAHYTVNARQADPAEAVLELTDGRGADAVFELVATHETMERSARMLSPRGRLVFVGYSEDAFHIHPIQLVIREACVMGSVGNTLQELHEAVELVAGGHVRTVVDRKLPLESHDEAIEALRGGELVGRAVLLP